MALFRSLFIQNIFRMVSRPRREVRNLCSWSATFSRPGSKGRAAKSLTVAFNGRRHGRNLNMIGGGLDSLRRRTISRLGRIAPWLLRRSVLPGKDGQRGRRCLSAGCDISRILLLGLSATSISTTGCLGDQGLERPGGSTAPGQRRRLGGGGSRRTSRFSGAPRRRTAISCGRGSGQIQPQPLRRRFSIPRIPTRACQINHCRLSGLRRRDGHGQLLGLRVRRLTQSLRGLHPSRTAIERAHRICPRLDAGRRMRDHLSFMVCASNENRVMGVGCRSDRSDGRSGALKGDTRIDRFAQGNNEIYNFTSQRSPEMEVGGKGGDSANDVEIRRLGCRLNKG